MPLPAPGAPRKMRCAKFSDEEGEEVEKKEEEEEEEEEEEKKGDRGEVDDEPGGAREGDQGRRRGGTRSFFYRGRVQIQIQIQIQIRARRFPRRVGSRRRRVGLPQLRGGGGGGSGHDAASGQVP